MSGSFSGCKEMIKDVSANVLRLETELVEVKNKNAIPSIFPIQPNFVLSATKFCIFKPSLVIILFSCS